MSSVFLMRKTGWITEKRFSLSWFVGTDTEKSTSKTKERPCRKAAHEMHEKWYTGAAELGRGTVCHQECVK